MVYGQHEVVRDLIATRMAAQGADDGRILFECSDVAVDGFEGGQAQELRCGIIAG